jgi:sugar lactone lactonase YvrE
MFSDLMFISLLSLTTLSPFFSYSQLITTIAGGGTGGDGGPATNASLINPGYIAIDNKGCIYISENSAHRVRKIDNNGIISTIAGTGTIGFAGDGGLANASKLNQPAGIAVDSVGNVFISDAVNNRIRKIDYATGVINTVVGNSFGGYNGDNIDANLASLKLPDGIWFDKKGRLFICDAGNLRLRMIDNNGVIHTVAGTGMSGWGGNGELAILTKCYPYSGVCIDSKGNTFFTEWTWGVVRKIDTNGLISTVAGDTSSHLYNGDGIESSKSKLDPFSIVIDSEDNLYISDAYNNRIRKIRNDGVIQTIAGIGVYGNTGDNGLATLAKIHSPSGLVFDSCGNLYFCQTNTPRIRKIEFNPYCWPTNVKNVENRDDFDFSLYPNPVTEEMIVRGNKLKSIVIYNAVGQMVYEQEFNKAEMAAVNVSKLPLGVYVVHVNGVWVGKVVKE